MTSGLGQAHICLWLIRKASKPRMLLLAAIAIAAAPHADHRHRVRRGVAAGWPRRLGRAATPCLHALAALLPPRTRRPSRRPGPRLGAGWATGDRGLPHLLLLAPSRSRPGSAGGLCAWRSTPSPPAGGYTATAPITFDARQWKRQVAPPAPDRRAGAVPCWRGRRIPVGGTIRAIGHRWHPSSPSPPPRAPPMVIVGATGSGKPTDDRLWPAGSPPPWPRPDRKGHRPLLVVLDCKGGATPLKADRTRAALRRRRPRVAIWPTKPPEPVDLRPGSRRLLYQMIDSGTGAAAYYATSSKRPHPRVTAPPAARQHRGVPDRLDARWLQTAWDPPYPAKPPAQSRRRSCRHPARYATLLDASARAGRTRHLADADAWYCILEGTANPPSRSPAMASPSSPPAPPPTWTPNPRHAPGRDDYSAVSAASRCPTCTNAAAPSASASSPPSLARPRRHRRRAVPDRGTADGGIFVCTPLPERCRRRRHSGAGNRA